MTVVEKAGNIIDKMYSWSVTSKKAKECALIAVDEILVLITAIEGTEYWQEFYEEVKQEIKNQCIDNQ